MVLAALIAAQSTDASAAPTPDIGDYEGRIITSVEVVIEGSPRDAAAEAEFVSLLHVASGTQYTAVRVRESLQALFDSGLIADARVEVSENCRPSGNAGGPPLCVRFVVHRQVKVGEVKLSLIVPLNSPISEDEMRARLNMLEPGSRLSEQVLKTNADLIQAYVRDKGFYRAEVSYAQVRDASDPSGVRQTVIFTINPGEQASVAAFKIDIKGFDISAVQPKLKLQSGASFTRAALAEDIARIRQAIISTGYLAPQLEDERVILDPQKNEVTISLEGGIGPKVEVVVTNYQLKEKVVRTLLPIKREGNIDFSAIEEGRRRLTNKIQENGYFFAEITTNCTVTPPIGDAALNGTSAMCENLNPQGLTGHTVKIDYVVERGRRFKLTDIRIEGTTELKIEDVVDELRTQTANALGFIPLLGYGRGYTSRELLVQDQRTIKTRMQEIGFRRAKVTVRQGVSIEGENLIITFVVDEGPRTKIAGLEVRGNKIYSDARLRDVIMEAGRARCAAKFDAGDYTPCFRTAVDQPFSRAQARADGDAILNLYAREGFVDAGLEFSSLELPKTRLPDGREEEHVRLLYTITREGDKVFVNRIIVNGNVRTAREAILELIYLKEGDVLRADRITDSERALYATDAFRQVIIRTEPAGETDSGFKKRDVIIDVEELKPREMRYGGGYSTDNGPLGFFDIRNLNLFGKLRQGAFRVRASRRQQIVRLEYLDPRFQRYGDNQFAPLALSAQYQRDTTVTRFFRSTIDRGAFGIVQRLDKDGKPIDEFGQPAGEPTINRFTINAETQRVLDRNTRSVLFLRYSYEDVRLYNINSLLIASILRPDRAIRLSRFGATYVRDTRNSQFDTQRGDFLTLDYSLALSQLGGNLSFNKFQVNYRRYYQLKQVRGTVLAGNVTLGLANLFNPRDRNDNGVIDDIDKTLPISERFFAGGSTTLRGFGFEEAGPRVAVPECFLQSPIPGGCGIFRNQKRELIQLDPFTVPIGGNALAVVNLEARTSLTKVFQVVPFYDGGNVFRRVGDIFGRGASAEDDPMATLAERINAHNRHARWTHTVGLGLGIKTPLGGTLSVDYGWLLNPPEFLIPQATGDPAIFRPKRGQLHFRFTRAF
ncbi:MAG: outer membrane protein insertion porin family [Acidobacteriota bacterium]|jgi:outer membrane protein insertion porin family|nr:outer membrane protein insertion porin family [Acidobacteriota bacterium]